MSLFANQLAEIQALRALPQNQFQRRKLMILKNLKRLQPT